MKTQVIKRDAIIITDEDILNAFSYTLWGMSHNEVLKANSKEYKDFTQEFIDYVASRKKRNINFFNRWY